MVADRLLKLALLSLVLFVIPSSSIEPPLTREEITEKLPSLDNMDLSGAAVHTADKCKSGSGSDPSLLERARGATSDTAERVERAFTDTFTRSKEAAGDVKDAAGNVVPQQVKDATGEARNAAENVPEKVRNVPEKAENAAEKVAGGVSAANVADDGDQKADEDKVAGITERVEKAFADFTSTVKEKLSFEKPDVGKMKDAAGTVPQQAKDAVPEKVKDVAGDAAAGKVTDAAGQTVPEKVKDAVPDSVKDVTGTAATGQVKDAATKLKDSTTHYTDPEEIAEAVAGMAERVEQAFSGFTKTLKEKLHIDDVEPEMEQVKDTAQNVGDQAKESGGNVQERVKEASGGFQQRVQEAAGSVMNKVKDVGDVEQVKRTARDLPGKMVPDQVKDQATRFQQKVQETAGKVQGQAGDAAGNVKETGDNVIEETRGQEEKLSRKADEIAGDPLADETEEEDGDKKKPSVFSNIAKKIGGFFNPNDKKKSKEGSSDETTEEEEFVPKLAKDQVAL
jgi:uncharacterized protein YjbJ (UPF0337 family)